MANSFSFNSPSVKFKELDLTTQSPSLGVTTLALVGETQKGRAFEPTFITNKSEFRKLFGFQSNEKIDYRNNGKDNSPLKYLTPFYANSYLTEGNQLWVTRVLGLSGYQASTGWALKVSAGLDPSTTSITNTVTTSVNFTGNTYENFNVTGVGSYYSSSGFIRTGNVFNCTQNQLDINSYEVEFFGGFSGTSATAIIGGISGNTIGAYMEIYVDKGVVNELLGSYTFLSGDTITSFRDNLLNSINISSNTTNITASTLSTDSILLTAPASLGSSANTWSVTVYISGNTNPIQSNKQNFSGGADEIAGTSAISATGSTKINSVNIGKSASATTSIATLVYQNASSAIITFPSSSTVTSGYTYEINIIDNLNSTSSTYTYIADSGDTENYVLNQIGSLINLGVSSISASTAIGNTITLTAPFLIGSIGDNFQAQLLENTNVVLDDQYSFTGGSDGRYRLYIDSGNGQDLVSEYYAITGDTLQIIRDNLLSNYSHPFISAYSQSTNGILIVAPISYGSEPNVGVGNWSFNYQFNIYNTITNFSNTGRYYSTIETYVDKGSGNEFLGSYTFVSGDTTTTFRDNLLNSINSNSNTTNITASTLSTDSILLTAPASLGASANTWVINVYTTGTTTYTKVNFNSGVDEIPITNAIPATGIIGGISGNTIGAYIEAYVDKGFGDEFLGSYTFVSGDTTTTFRDNLLNSINSNSNTTNIIPNYYSTDSILLSAPANSGSSANTWIVNIYISGNTNPLETSGQSFGNGVDPIEPTPFISGTGFYTINTIIGYPYEEYNDMVVAVIRSRGSYINNQLLYNSTGLTLDTSFGANTDLFGNFTLTTSGLDNETYICNLNPDSSGYISNVLGDKPKGKNTALYVEAVYPDLIKKLNSINCEPVLSSTLVKLDTDVFNDFETQYQTPSTPWVVSELRGSKVEKLFKFISISDGDSANKEIKISIQRLDFDNKEFDIIIRDFNDTDDKIVILESFTRCSLDPSLPSYVGKRIGSKTENQNDLDYDVKSNYVYLEIAADVPIDAMPCGFEGYYLRNYSAENTGDVSAKTPTIFYKTSYSETDKKSRVYLGISERGYDTTSNGSGINQNLFNYLGVSNTISSYTKTKGFHLDSGATSTYTDGEYFIGEFSVGEAKLQTSLDTISGIYSDVASRKFTLVPYGGFDGWNIFRDERTNKGSYAKGKTNYLPNNDYDAYLTGIETFNNPEETPMTLFATPGINWYDHIDLVEETIDLVERTRQGDALYIIDAPDMQSDEFVEDLVDKLNTVDIDSSYCATYAPYIQVLDNDSGFNVFLPPTGEVLRVMALTDKISFPWFAPAGTKRGLITKAKQVRKKLSEPERDILYPARINPIAKFNDIGVDIFGQKTLQIKQSVLDRINVRRLLIYSKQVIRQIAKGVLFEPNDDTTINNFLANVNKILTNIQRERGLESFLVRLSAENTPESRDRNEVYFDILLIPTKSIEYIGISFIISPSGVQFNA